MNNKWNADLIQVQLGPITRAQAKKFKETLNGFIQNIWVEIHKVGFPLFQAKFMDLFVFK